ncbi:MAG: 1-phosphofructokinase [Anaerolineae bacterium]
MIITVTPNPVLDRTMNVPQIVFNEMIRATDIREDWGGKGFNVSRALHELGAKSLAMGFVGGATGAKVEGGLHDLGIRTDLVPIDGETRTNVVITETDGERYVKVNEAGPTVTQDEVEIFFDQATKRARSGDLWALCGSLPPGVPLNFYARLTTVLRERGARVLLDASGEPFRLGVEAGPYLVKPNLAEAGAWMGRTIQSKAEAAGVVGAFLDWNVKLVALSLGADGLMLANRKERIWAKPPVIAERNPVGAGDALLAGLAWALERSMPLKDVARWAVATGTAAAAREGVSMGSRQEVEEVFEQVELVAWPER